MNVVGMSVMGRYAARHSHTLIGVGSSQLQSGQIFLIV